MLFSSVAFKFRTTSSKKDEVLLFGLCVSKLIKKTELPPITKHGSN